MPNDRSKPHQNTFPTENLSDAAILRLAADSELLPPHIQTRLEALRTADPTAMNRIAFEKTLRAACNRSLNINDPAVNCPTHLRQQVLSAIRSTTTPESQQSQLRLTESNHTPFASPPSSSKRNPFTLRAFMNIAAVIALLAAATLFLRTTVLPGANPNSPGVALASFLATEHTACSTDFASRHDKFVITDPSEIPSVFRSVLSTSPSIPDMQALGLEFRGAGRCHVPGDGASIHLLFSPPQEKLDQLCQSKDHSISLFIQTDTGQFDIAAGETYVLKSPDGNRAVMAWKADGLLHYLVTSCPINCNKISHALEAPPSRRDVETFRCASRRR